MRIRFANALSMVSIAASFTMTSHAWANDPLAGLPKAVAQRHAALIQDQTCMPDQPFDSEAFTLANGLNLYLVPCIFGAYQGSSRGYITEGNGNLVTEVKTLAFDEETKSIVGNLDLGSVSYDAKTGVLSTYSKARGIGDCGQSSESQVLVGPYGGVTIKTFEIRDKSECDEKDTTWPVVYKQ